MNYLETLTKVLGVGAAFASIPLFAALADLEPPWPPAIGYVSAALVLLASLIAWEWTRRSRGIDRRRMIRWSTIFAILGLLGYLILYSLFVEPVPGAALRVVRGFTCTYEAQQVYGARCPDLPRDALREAEWESVMLWTRGSVTTVRMGLTATWLLFTAGLIGAVGSVIAGRKF